MLLVDEILAQLRAGVTVKECALRYSLAESTIRSYKTGRRGNKTNGRPRALTEEQVKTAFAVWSAGEANMYEIAAVYAVSVQTIKNYMLKELDRQCSERL